MFRCKHCPYGTPYLHNLKRHSDKIHQAIHTGSGVLQNAHQTGGQNVYQSQEVNACITL